ncbi:hypothetical protein BKA67DRAFT_559031 [Truncatella angustata]|uniref:Uncharacterized protein n=1 Tax=Truncatella angustata TaxID=152316 RepID=A0A9P8UMZ3_9PEZI|nr:uncharacterized protein BKA67DRAFT_559031 [Truncatella angustata]KAH6654941.1 hypothetical protein BKA67DRAFT_559031 [Truncatella angustata]
MPENRCLFWSPGLCRNLVLIIAFLPLSSSLVLKSLSSPSIVGITRATFCQSASLWLRPGCGFRWKKMLTCRCARFCFVGVIGVIDATQILQNIFIRY